jgi:hypothetical protein
VAVFASFQGTPSGDCLNSADLAGPGDGSCPGTTSGFSSSDLLAGPAPANGAVVSNLEAVTNASITGSTTWLVAVIDNTTGATLLSCTITSTSGDACSNATGSGTAAAAQNIEVKVTSSGSNCNPAQWRVTFRD